MENKKAFALAKANEIKSKAQSMRAGASQKKAQIDAKRKKAVGLSGQATVLAKKPAPKRK